MRVNVTLQRLVSVAVSISAGQVPCSDFSCTFCLTCGRWQATSQSVLLSLAEVLGFPVKLRFRGQLEAGQSITQNLGAPSLAVFFLLSAAALVSLSSGSSEQKALG